jgi:hypothetical protein
MGGSGESWLDKVKAAENCSNGNWLEFMDGFDTEKGMGWTTYDKVADMFVDGKEYLFKPVTVESGGAQVEVQIQLWMKADLAIKLRKV